MRILGNCPSNIAAFFPLIVLWDHAIRVIFLIQKEKRILFHTEAADRLMYPFFHELPGICLRNFG